MKTKELKRPFFFADRKIVLQDEILFIPEYYSDFHTYNFPGWSQIFGNNHPIVIEYCSGNGKWISEKAKSHPEINWVAIEKRFDRVKKIWLNKKNHGLTNLFIICAEGNIFTTNYAASDEIHKVFINFPDPWPKTKHAKHRIMHEDFKKQLHRILRKDGKVILTTDDKNYLEKSVTLMEGDKFLLDQLVEDPNFLGDSYFLTLWQKMGRKIYYAEFSKQ